MHIQHNMQSRVWVIYPSEYSYLVRYINWVNGPQWIPFEDARSTSWTAMYFNEIIKAITILHGISSDTYHYATTIVQKEKWFAIFCHTSEESIQLW